MDFQYEIPNPIFVGIHVRRIAYDYHLSATQNGSLVQVEYFKRAINALQNSLNLTNQKDKDRVSHELLFFLIAPLTKYLTIFLLSTDDLPRYLR